MESQALRRLLSKMDLVQPLLMAIFISNLLHESPCHKLTKTLCAWSSSIWGDWVWSKGFRTKTNALFWFTWTTFHHNFLSNITWNSYEVVYLCLFSCHTHLAIARRLLLRNIYVNVINYTSGAPTGCGFCISADIDWWWFFFYVKWSRIYKYLLDKIFLFFCIMSSNINGININISNLSLPHVICSHCVTQRQSKQRHKVDY